MKPAPNSASKSLVIDLAVILVASIAVVLPIYIWGIPYGNDMPQHYQFALQFESNLSQGGVYPSWAFEANGGLGDVGVRFYPPLPYYALVLFKTLAGDWYIGSVLTFAFWFCLGGCGIYFFAREWFDGRSALLAAIVFTWLPYHVNQIYNAFFYAEFAGTAVLTFCFLFVSRVVRRGSKLDILGLSASLAILVLTHLPTAVMGLIALGIYALAELWERRELRSFLSLAAAGLLGAAASAFYWMKLVTEIGYVKHSTAEFIRTSFDFHSNFLAAYFYVGPDDYVSRSLWFADLILLFTVAMIICAIAVRRIAGPSDERSLFPIAAVATAGLFLATPLSWLIWQNFGLLQKIQFPFRFLAVISICASLFVAASFRSFLKLAATKYRPFAIVSAGLLLASIVFSFSQVIRPAIYRARPEFELMLTDRAAAKSCECWWPVWAKPSAVETTKDKNAEQTRLMPIHVNGVQHSASTTASVDGKESVNVFYYPHWKLIEDGTVSDVYSDEMGKVQIHGIPSTARPSLVFTEPIYVRAAQILSSAAWVFILVFAIARIVVANRNLVQK